MFECKGRYRCGYNCFWTCCTAMSHKKKKKTLMLISQEKEENLHAYLSTGYMEPLNLRVHYSAEILR